MKYTMEKIIRQGVLESEKIKIFLNSIAETYVKFDKAKKRHYLFLLENTRYIDVNGVHEHIIKFMNYYK